MDFSKKNVRSIFLLWLWEQLFLRTVILLGLASHGCSELPVYFFWLKIVELILYHPTLALFCYPARQTHRFLFLLLSSICPAYIKLSRQSLHSTTSCILLLLVTFSFLFVLLSIQSNSSRTLLAFNMLWEC